MVNPALPISTLVNVTGSFEPTAAQGQNTSTLLVLGSSAVIDPVTRIRTYTSEEAVATDFGNNAPETLTAQIWFSQTPQPQSIDIGRWVQTASAGQLYGAPLTAAQQAIAVWNAVADGGFDVSINGTPLTITELDFAAAANLNAVAAAIQTALNAVLAGATCVWNSVYSRFVITSPTTGAASTVTFLTAPAEGTTDISGMLGMTAASSGAYIANGIVAETALAAATIFDDQFGGQWYGMMICGAADADHQAVAAFLAASSNKHYYFVPTQEAGVFTPGNTENIAYELMTAETGKCAVQYNGGSPYAIASLAAKMLTVNWGGSDTTIPAAWQTEPGVAADNLTSSQLAALLANNCNAFLNWSNGAAITYPGIGSDGNWIDAVIGADVLTIAIQTAVFDLLQTQTVGQDDAGNHLIKVTIENVLAQWVTNGFIAKGLPWNGAGFGSLQEGQTLSKGYYVYVPPMASQQQSQRTARIGGPFQIAVKLRGAIQTCDVVITFQN